MHCLKGQVNQFCAARVCIHLPDIVILRPWRQGRCPHCRQRLRRLPPWSLLLLLLLRGRALMPCSVRRLLALLPRSRLLLPLLC